MKRTHRERAVEIALILLDSPRFPAGLIDMTDEEIQEAASKAIFAIYEGEDDFDLSLPHEGVAADVKERLIAARGF